MTQQPSAAFDERHLDELDHAGCLSRLASKQVGRLAVMVDHYPQVFPVNYRLDDTIVVFRTHLGTKLLTTNHANVGFQVDDIDPSTHDGWSVLIQGMAEDITDFAPNVTTERSRKLGVVPWAPGDKSRIVRVIPARMTGRQLHAGELRWWSDDRGYL